MTDFKNILSFFLPVAGRPLENMAILPWETAGYIEVSGFNIYETNQGCLTPA